jgi:hypothetical protein
MSLQASHSMKCLGDDIGTRRKRDPFIFLIYFSFLVIRCVTKKYKYPEQTSINVYVQL